MYSSYQSDDWGKIPPNYLIMHVLWPYLRQLNLHALFPMFTGICQIKIIFTVSCLSFDA